MGRFQDEQAGRCSALRGNVANAHGFNAPTLGVSESGAASMGRTRSASHGRDTQIPIRKPSEVFEQIEEKDYSEEGTHKEREQEIYDNATEEIWQARDKCRAEERYKTQTLKAIKGKASKEKAAHQVTYGAFDFETWEWVNPYCCVLLWGTPDNRQSEFLIDPYSETLYSNAFQRRFKNRLPKFIDDKCNPLLLAEQVLYAMYHIENVDVWWAHNMGKFDGLFLSAAAKRLHWEQSAIVAQGSRCIRFTMRPPGAKRVMVIQDLYALLPSKLKRIAEDFELPSRKLFDEDDYSKDVRTWDKDRLKAGCFIDCQLVLEALEKLTNIVENDFGSNLRATFSSTALGILKSDLSKRGISIPSHKKLHSVELNITARHGYYGGRVEVFHHCPSGKLSEWDVNSSYPWSMKHDMPWEPLGWANSRQIQQMMMGELEGMIYAKVSVSDMPYPPLPYRTEQGDTLFFPVGEWEAWFPACELRYAQESCNVKVRPLRGICYTKYRPFDAFVNSVYAIKQNAKGAKRSFAKLTLNGCYGKFAEHPEKTVLRVFGDAYDARMFMFENAGKCEMLVPSDPTIMGVTLEYWPHHAHYAIAAYIAGYSRIKLHKGMVSTTGLAYVDTDACHANTMSENADVSFGLDLGEWKLEMENYEGRFFAPKIYELSQENGEKHLAAKGFPVDPESFAKLISLEEVRKERMRLLRSQLRAGGNDVRRIMETKVWAGLSQKRKPYEDGTTRPWTIAEIGRKEYLEALSPIVEIERGN